MAGGGGAAVAVSAGPGGGGAAVKEEVAVKEEEKKVQNPSHFLLENSPKFLSMTVVFSLTSTMYSWMPISCWIKDFLIRNMENSSYDDAEFKQLFLVG
jgi:hypothetical protein